jgi:hypothetical protein
MQNRRKRKIRSSSRKEQGSRRRKVPIIASRSPIPRWTNPSSLAKGKLCAASRCWSSSLPRRGLGIPRCRNLGVGWKRGTRQQEDANHPTSLAARDPQRRGVEQAPRKRHDCAGWGFAKHPRGLAAKEDREGVNNILVSIHQYSCYISCALSIPSRKTP